ncbi:hypothetical protein ACI75Y_07960 [Capnocytophaga stomatis]|uniref:hypothetical protein n=1 Tax=Capnocytophaga stomatis TaxID=1848904 RepID=UPI00385E5B7C
MKELSKILNHINQILFSKEFELSKSKESGYVIYEYRKKSIHSIKTIAFLEKENVMNGFYYSINFIEMERIITPILTKNNLFGDVKPENINDSFYIEKEKNITFLMME